MKDWNLLTPLQHDTQYTLHRINNQCCNNVDIICSSEVGVMEALAMLRVGMLKVETTYSYLHVKVPLASVGG